MKKTALCMVLTFVMLLLIAGCSSKDDDTNVLAIRDIQNDPLSFTGELTINGIVAAFVPDDRTIFGIMDTAELIACKNLQCGAFMLPVQYVGGGSTPELADEVNITGSWIETADGFIFEVTKIDVKRNIMDILMS